MFKPSIFAGTDHAVLGKESPIDWGGVSSLGVDSTGEQLFKRESDIFLLFHQEKLIEKMGVTSLRNWIDSLNSQSSSIDYSKFTDEQLLRFVKSRYVQEPSDIARWSEYLNDEANELRRSFEQYAQSLSVSTDSSVKPPKDE